MADIGYMSEEDEFDDFDEEDMELEDLESEDETEGEESETEAQPSALADRVLSGYNHAKEKGAGFVENSKEKLETALTKNKGKLYSYYDKVMNFKDDVHYGFKNIKKKAGQAVEQGWGNVKTGVTTLKNKVAGSKFGQMTKRGIGAVKTGAATLKNKMADSKFGQWIAKKKAERAAKADEAGFFTKAWGKVKTGAAALKDKIAGSKFGQMTKRGIDAVKTGATTLKNKIADSKLGQWIAKKKAERAAKADEPGFFKKTWDKVKTGATALKDMVKGQASKLINKAANSKAGKWVLSEAAQGKEWLGKQKEWLYSMKDKITDELDDHEFERRMNYKAKEGDTDYQNRYFKLLDELKDNPEIQELRGRVSAEEIKELTRDLEAGKEEKEGGGIGKKISGALDLAASGANSDIGKGIIKDKLGDTAAEYAVPVLQGASGLVNAGTNFTGAVKAAKRARNIAGVSKTLGGDKELERTAQYSLANSKKQAVSSAFDVGTDLATTVKKLTKKIPGAGMVNKIASVTNTALGQTKKLVVSSMDKEARKTGLKGILGGVEGYKKLKEKYRLQAPEMRRAIREAVGVDSEEAVVNTDKKNLSQKLSARVGNKDEAAISLASAMGAGNEEDMYQAMGGTKGPIRRKNYNHASRQMAAT